MKLRADNAELFSPRRNIPCESHCGHSYATCLQDQPPRLHSDYDLDSSKLKHNGFVRLIQRRGAAFPADDDTSTVDLTVLTQRNLRFFHWLDEMVNFNRLS